MAYQNSDSPMPRFYEQTAWKHFGPNIFHYEDLCERALNDGWGGRTPGKTPERSVNSTLNQYGDKFVSMGDGGFRLHRSCWPAMNYLAIMKQTSSDGMWRATLPDFPGYESPSESDRVKLEVSVKEFISLEIDRRLSEWESIPMPNATAVTVSL